MGDRLTSKWPLRGDGPSSMWVPEVPQNFGWVCCSIRPQKLIFYSILRKNFWKFGVCVVLWVQFISKKICQNSIHFRIFFSKNLCFKLQNGLISEKIVKKYKDKKRLKNWSKIFEFIWRMKNFEINQSCFGLENFFTFKSEPSCLNAICYNFKLL